MADRVEITDEMVERARIGSGFYTDTPDSRALIRRMLDAAINGPPEPEPKPICGELEDGA